MEFVKAVIIFRVNVLNRFGVKTDRALQIQKFVFIIDLVFRLPASGRYTKYNKVFQLLFKSYIYMKKMI